MTMLTIFAAAFFSPAAETGQFFFMKNENVGKEVRDFTLKMLNGGETNLQKYREGKKAIVFFWATWCPHCREALDDMTRQKEAIANKGIKLVLVDVGEEEGVVDKYVQKQKIDMDVFLDIDSKVSEAYDLIGVPTFYFVNEHGFVTDVQHSLPKDLDQAFSKS